MRSRFGFTLVETLIVVVIFGLLTLMAFPRMSSALVRNDLRGARTTTINLVAKARAVATQSNRRTWVRFAGNTAYVVARPRVDGVGGAQGADTVGGIQNLYGVYKVNLSVLTAGVDSIQFDPRGIGSGFSTAGVTIQLSRGGYNSSITIDGLGRVTK